MLLCWGGCENGYYPRGASLKGLEGELRSGTQECPGELSLEVKVHCDAECPADVDRLTHRLGYLTVWTACEAT